MTSVAEHIQRFMAEDGLGRLLGTHVVSLTPESCVFTYDVRPEHLNPVGILHGGALFSVMDSCQGMLVSFVVGGDGLTAATGTATIRYLAPVRSGRVVVSSTLVERQGRKLLVDSTATSPDHTTLALLRETWVTLPGVPKQVPG